MARYVAEMETPAGSIRADADAVRSAALRAAIRQQAVRPPPRRPDPDACWRAGVNPPEALHVPSYQARMVDLALQALHHAEIEAGTIPEDSKRSVLHKFEPEPPFLKNQNIAGRKYIDRYLRGLTPDGGVSTEDDVIDILWENDPLYDRLPPEERPPAGPRKTRHPELIGIRVEEFAAALGLATNRSHYEKFVRWLLDPVYTVKREVYMFTGVKRRQEDMAKQAFIALGLAGPSRETKSQYLHQTPVPKDIMKHSWLTEPVNSRSYNGGRGHYERARMFLEGMSKDEVYYPLVLESMWDLNPTTHRIGVSAQGAAPQAWKAGMGSMQYSEPFLHAILVEGVTIYKGPDRVAEKRDYHGLFALVYLSAVAKRLAAQGIVDLGSKTRREQIN